LLLSGTMLGRCWDDKKSKNPIKSGLGTMLRCYGSFSRIHILTAPPNSQLRTVDCTPNAFGAGPATNCN
jgi:hypothetical protein